MGKVKKRHTIQGLSDVSGLINLPAKCGKLDSALLSAILNLSMFKISGMI